MWFFVLILTIALFVCYSRITNLKNDVINEQNKINRAIESINYLAAENRKLIDQLMRATQQPVVQEMPQQPAVQEMPQQSAAQEMPQQSAVQEMPQQSAVQDMPQQPAVQEMPQQPAAQEMPQQPAVQEMPQQSAVQEMPQQPVMQEMPQQPAAQEMPQQPAAQEMPQQPVMEASPHTEMLLDAPMPFTASQPSGHPQIAPPEPAIEADAPAWPLPAILRRELNESWVGRNVLGIAASVLVFIGLLFLGVWAWNNVGDWLRVAMIFAVSGAITVLGITLGHKKLNVFTKILTGCGFGAVFISIFVTYLYFRMLGDIPAYCLLFGWLVATMAITRFQRSVYLSIVTHLGMAITICFAYVNMANYNLAFLHVYQYVSIAIIIVGNLLCYRQAYRFGLFLSLGLTIVASCYTLAGSPEPMAWAAASPLWAQFLCASYLSYLLSVSTARMEGASGARLVGPAHALNKLMWIAMLFVSVYLPVMRLAENTPRRFGVNDITSTTLFPILVCAAIVGLHIVFTPFLRRKQKLLALQETISISMVGFAWFALFAVLWQNQSHVNFPVFSYMCIPGIYMLLIGRQNSNRVYYRAACVYFAADLLSSLAISYGRLRTGGVIALAAAYIVFYLSVIVFMRKKLGFGERWERAAVYFAGGVWFMLLSMFWFDERIIATPNLVFMFVPGLILLGAGRISRNRAHFWAACVFFGADLLSALAIKYGELPRGGVIALAAGYIVFYLCLVVFLQKIWDFGKALERPAIFFASFVWLAMLVVLWMGGYILNSPNLTFLFVPGLLLLGVGAVSKSRAYGLAACGIFAADLLSVLLLRFNELPRGGVIALAAGYIVFFLCLVFFMRKKLGFDKLWESGAVFFACSVWFAMMAMLWVGGYVITTPNLTFMFVPGLLLIGAWAISKNRAYLWSACGFFAADLLSALLIRYDELPRGGVIALAAGYILPYLCLIVFMRKKLGFSERWERDAIYFSGVVWLILLAILWAGSYVVTAPSLAFFLLPGLLMLAAYQFSRNTAYKSAANAFLFLDLVFMLAVGYRELALAASVAAAFGYMLLYLAAIWYQWPLWAREKGASMPARLAAYCVVLASFSGILLVSGLEHRYVILGIALTAISVALFLLRYDGHGPGKRYEPLRLSMRIIEYLLFAVCTLMVSYAGKPTMLSAILYWLLAILTATVAFMRIRDVLMETNLAEQIAICLKVTLVILAFINGFAPDWFNAVYVLSLASMVSALICVIIGFISRAKPLRLYGLFLTLICVVKLITYDVSGLETPFRIVALIGGGIICFAISALYSYSENRLIPKETASGND